MAEYGESKGSVREFGCWFSWIATAYRWRKYVGNGWRLQAGLSINGNDDRKSLRRPWMMADAVVRVWCFWIFFLISSGLYMFCQIDGIVGWVTWAEEGRVAQR